jgi:CTP synthase (UTP-ammonia lyase)
VEYARNAAGLAEADHSEYDPEVAVPLITLAACGVNPAGGPRVSDLQPVWVEVGTRARRIYGSAEIEEGFACNYELNEAFEPVLTSRGLRISGRGARGEARVIELAEHPFYLATLFLPQLRSTDEAPHPLILAFLEAAANDRDR